MVSATETAYIMPAVLYSRFCRNAVYSCKFSIVGLLTSYFLLACGCALFVWGFARELHILCISVITLLSANLFLSIFNIFLPSDRQGAYDVVLKLLTVMTTAYGYSDAGLAEH